jgi:hypothetical protein
MGDITVSRKVITILFIIGSCFYIPGIAMILGGYVFLIQASLHPYYSAYASSPFASFGTFMSLIMLGAVMLVVGNITLLVSRIGALMEAAKAQEWVWFVLMIIFNWIVLLIYLIAVQKPKLAPAYAAYPYPPGFTQQPWSGYQPQAPGTEQPSAQPWSAYQPSVQKRDTPPAPQE